MLQVCDIGHKEVCYESVHCPVCLIKRELESVVTELRDRNKELTDQLESAEWEIISKIYYMF